MIFFFNSFDWAEIFLLFRLFFVIELFVFDHLLSTHRFALKHSLPNFPKLKILPNKNKIRRKMALYTSATLEILPRELLSRLPRFIEVSLYCLPIKSYLFTIGEETREDRWVKSLCPAPRKLIGFRLKVNLFPPK